MATLGLDDDELKSVEQMVSRLAQLSSSIQSLKMDILKSHPLPHPTSLQASAQILQRHLQTVLDSLAENQDLFSRMALHPSTNYPGRQQENVLTQLLRKKLEPDVEELVDRGRGAARLVTPEGLAMLQDVWDECRQWTQRRVAEYVGEEAGDVYTREEREKGVENVRTGLRRDLESDDDEDDEDEDDDSEDGNDDEKSDKPKKASAVEEPAAPKPPRGLEPETLLFFMARGDFAVPPNVEFERKADTYRGLMGVSGYQMPGSGPSAVVGAGIAPAPVAPAAPAAPTTVIDLDAMQP